MKKVLSLLLVSILLPACGGSNDSGGSNNAAPNSSVDTTAPGTPGLLASAIIAASVSDYSFSVSAAEVGTTALWSFTDDSNQSVSGSAAVTSLSQTFSGIDLSALNDGPINFVLTLRDSAGNSTDTGVLLNKDTALPTNYQLSTTITEIDAGNQAAFEFTVQTDAANVGSDYAYSIEDSAGATIDQSGTLNAATQTFSSIDVSALAIGNITVTFILIDTNGNVGDPVSLTLNKTNNGGDVTISGTVTFDFVPHHQFTNGLLYSATFAKTARGVEVILLDDADNVIGSTITDNSGYYELSVAVDTDVRVRVNARLLSEVSPAWDTRVSDNTNNNALYVMQGSLLNSGSSNSVRDLHAASGWTGASYGNPRVAAPFAILDVVYESLLRISDGDPSLDFPELEIGWSINNTAVDGDVADGDIGNSHFNSGDGKIYILGKANADTDEYDGHIIAHEWCHYFVDALSISDSLGGPHTVGDRLDLALAYSEGLCNAFSGIILNDSVFRDSSGTNQSFGFGINMENNAFSNSGWYNELSITSIIYDIYDSNDDAVDTIDVDFSTFTTILTSGDYIFTEAATSIYLFLDLLKDELFPDHVSVIDVIDDLADAQNITANDPLGTGETNNAGDARVLPIFHQATVGGGAVEVCSINNFGTKNKLGVYARVLFTIPTSGSYTVSATRSSGATNSNPDLYIRINGSYFILGNSTVVDSESKTGGLNSGDYLLVVFDAHNIGDDPGDDYCFNVQIN